MTYSVLFGSLLFGVKIGGVVSTEKVKISGRFGTVEKKNQLYNEHTGYEQCDIDFIFIFAIRLKL